MACIRALGSRLFRFVCALQIKHGACSPWALGERHRSLVPLAAEYLGPSELLALAQVERRSQVLREPLVVLAEYRERGQEQECRVLEVLQVGNHSLALPVALQEVPLVVLAECQGEEQECQVLVVLEVGSHSQARMEYPGPVERRSRVLREVWLVALGVYLGEERGCRVLVEPEVASHNPELVEVKAEHHSQVLQEAPLVVGRRSIRGRSRGVGRWRRWWSRRWRAVIRGCWRRRWRCWCSARGRSRSFGRWWCWRSWRRGTIIGRCWRIWSLWSVWSWWRRGTVVRSCRRRRWWCWRSIRGRSRSVRCWRSRGRRSAVVRCCRRCRRCRWCCGSAATTILGS